jgi:hypothetical protein
MTVVADVAFVLLAGTCTAMATGVMPGRTWLPGTEKPKPAPPAPQPQPEEPK